VNGSEELDTCGACEGLRPATPVPVTNRPGLPALTWRVGTHGRFKRSLLAGLARPAALRELTARDDDDPSVALIDAWAAVLDVLAFYQERIAQEHYLRTATERHSILELARAIGYELAPGVSADAWLAFACDVAAGAPETSRLPAGTQVQSVPGPDEKPQIFETSADLAARPAWNALPVRTWLARTPTAGQTVLHFRGLATGLQPGDALLVVEDPGGTGAPSSRWDFRRARAVKPMPHETDPALSRTEVTLDAALGATPAQSSVRVFALRQRAALFGHNAPDPRLLGSAVPASMLTTSGDWKGFNLAYQDSGVPATISQLLLEAPNKAAVVGGWAVVTAAGQDPLLLRITGSAETGRSKFALNAKVQRLTLQGATNTLASRFGTLLRETTVFLSTDELELVARPDTSAIAAGSTALDLGVRLAGDDVLPAGRELLLAGERASDGEPVAERTTLLQAATVSVDGRVFTRLQFPAGLAHAYRRETLRVHANVVAATHGETVVQPRPAGPPISEVLGSGDAAVAFQRFKLKRRPLTYVGADNPRGRATSLEVRVNDVRWLEVPSLYGRGPDDRVYTVRQADDGTTTVQFGDGRTGARLPTGQENITAFYRVGTGLEGLVSGGRLTLLLTRPLGVKEVTNPLPASGADEPETLDDARRSAPLTVLTLDRAVSLQDFEDFARAFAGIGKARVEALWTGQKRVAHLTVALADGASPAPSAVALQRLRAALDAARHPVWPVHVAGFVARPARVVAKIAVDPDHDAAGVLAAVRARLGETFACARREFAQDLSTAEVITAMQAVAGVVFVDLDLLAFVGGAAATHGRLEARPARFAAAVLHPAELVTLAASQVTLTAIAP
jgi:hypothetical protein